MGRILAMLPLLAACEVSDDPAEGGFVSGVAGIVGGGYEARIAEREARVAAAEAEGARIAAEEARLRGASAAAVAELSSLGGTLAGLQTRIASQRSELATAGRPVDAGTSARIAGTLAATPEGQTEAERIANLRRAISEARALSDDLARLGA